MSGQLPRRRLFGLEFVDAPSEGSVATDLLEVDTDDLPRGTLPIVVTPNVDHIVKLDRRLDPVAVEVAARAAWILPDGQPIVWASHLLGVHLSSRIAGSDLVASLFPRLVDEGRTVVVIATSGNVARRVADESADVHAVVAPMLDLADRPAFDAFVERCADLIAEVRPSHVFVTLGFPKQCNVISGLLDRNEGGPRPIFLAVGASFDMYYGLVRRAPEWMQRWGLEWFFRFVQEPRRLFRRYFVDDPAFVLIAWREWRRDRQESSERRRDRRRFEA